MPYLLNLLYVTALVIASPWMAWSAIAKGKMRGGFGARYLGLVPRRQGNDPCVWLHAVSVGEVNLLAPLLKRLAAQRPGWSFYISTTTKTGYTLARQKYADHCVFYCPFDFSWAVRTAMRRIRPTALVLAELEIWPNLVRAARESGARVAVVNGRLSERSFRGYRRFAFAVSRVFRSLDLVAAQTDEYAERFRMLGSPADRVHAVGSLKFDGAETDRGNAATMRLRQLAGISNDDVVFLAGSTQEPEEALALAAYRELATEFPNLRLILVPRHPDRFGAVARLLETSGLVWSRRSALESGKAPPEWQAMLVDTIGELGAWWGTARIAFVGGSLGDRGGQNMIEPAAYGAAVAFGPNTRNFADVVARLLAADAARVVHDGESLLDFVRQCLQSPEFADSLGRRARQVVFEELGAADRTTALVLSLAENERFYGRRAA